jgi:hypothetical protein
LSHFAVRGKMARMSKLTTQISLSVLAALLIATNVVARTPDDHPNAIAVPWSDVGSLILDEKIRVSLPTGAVVEGKVLAFHPESLELQIQKTSDNTIQPKGKIVVPRTSLHLLKLLKPRKKWRIILTSVGAGVAIPLWAFSEYSYNESGGASPPPLGVMMAVGGAAGYLGGWALDRPKEVTITIQ